MKKLELDSKKVLLLTGAAVAVGSLIAIADYADRKRRDRAAHPVELVAGIAGLLVGAVLATEPRRRENRERVLVDDMFTDEDAALADEQIRETLNREDDGAAEAVPPADRLRTIEVDNETSIEDFI